MQVIAHYSCAKLVAVKNINEFMYVLIFQASFTIVHLSHLKRVANNKLTMLCIMQINLLNPSWTIDKKRM